MNRFAYSGLLAAALALTACFSSGGDGGRTSGAGNPAGGGAAPAAAKAPIDARNPAVTETATFGLG